MAERFIHPIHARGVRSPRMPLPSRRLSDSAIHRYALEGRYGELARQRAQSVETNRRVRATENRLKNLTRTDSVFEALRTLHLL